METKVNKRHEIPAGILRKVEIFTHQGEIFGIQNGQTKPFNRLPSHIQQSFMRAFIADRKFHRHAKDVWHLETFTKVFYKWMDCAFGTINDIADINPISDNLTNNTNSWCGDCLCTLAGKNCTLPYGLKLPEIETLREFKKGYTANQIAGHLHRSKMAIISRIEKIKINLGATNIAHLSSITPLV